MCIRDSSWIAISPSADRVEVEAMKRGNEEGGIGTCRVWSVGLDGATPVVEVARDRWFDQFAPWNEDGSLRIYSRDGKLVRRDDVDVASGATRATKTYD